MIAKAAVKIELLTNFYDWATDPGEIVIPCHRHVDAYEILHMFHLRKDIEYKVIAEGFLDENDNFMTRREAWDEAERCNQFRPCYMYIDDVPGELYSEDMW